jgi:hypothetical protein
MHSCNFLQQSDIEMIGIDPILILLEKNDSVELVVVVAVTLEAVFFRCLPVLVHQLVLVP